MRPGPHAGRSSTGKWFDGKSLMLRTFQRNGNMIKRPWRKVKGKISVRNRGNSGAWIEALAQGELFVG